MGHTWREMDPVGAAVQDKYFDRLQALQNKLRDVPLSQFTVGELEPVMKMMGLLHNIAGHGNMSESDFKILEQKKIKK